MLQTIAVTLTWCLGIFVASNTIFDVVHFLLHRWRHSKIGMLRTFSALHQVHHDFLDKKMQVHPELAGQNLWAHLFPEYLTTVVGTALFFLIAPWVSVCMILILHTALFAGRIWQEGADSYHMSMDRVSGQRGSPIFSTPSYHAQHHVNPLAFYASFLSVFDLIFGTAVALRGKRVMVTGISGAFGSSMAALLERHGARIEQCDARAPWVPDWSAIDILILAHGARGPEAWAANYWSMIHLADSFIDATKNRLSPPEIWAVGSESELWEAGSYGASKRALAAYAARNWRKSKDVTYRHIVPAAYRSRMGKFGLTGPKPVVWLALFLIKRGFTYIPVTWTSLAYWNWFVYRMRG